MRSCHHPRLLQDNFLIVATYDSLYQLSLDSESWERILLDTHARIRSAAFDPVEKKVYWSGTEKVIRRVNLDGTGEEIIHTVEAANIKIDPVSRILYYTNNGLNVMTLDGRNVFRISKYGGYIALDSARGKMFVSGRDYHDFIGITAMDGTQYTPFIKTVDLPFRRSRVPRNLWGLTIDAEGKQLYYRFQEGYFQEIYSASVLNSSDARVVAHTSTPPGALVSLGDILYYSDDSFVMKINISESADQTPQPVGPGINSLIYSMSAFSNEYHILGSTSTNPCTPLNGGCEHICLPTPQGPQCSCLDGFNAVNGTRCSIPTYTCPQEYKSRRGRIMSPGFPGYRNNVYCKIVIGAAGLKRVFLFIEEFDLEDKDILLHSSRQMKLRNMHNYTVDLDPCRSLPCQNGGWCEEQSTGYTCICRPGTIGDLCQIDNHCASLACDNGGSCIHVPGGIMCDCKPGFTRDHCQQDIDECLSNPCQNGGNCSTPQVAMFSCDCVAGYTGDNCESDIDECASSPCHNGARCSTSRVDMFSCDCLAGYTGRNCEIDLDTCRSQPCQNAGTCHSLTDAFLCACVAGFMGDVCEKDTNTCHSDPCLNGGTCRDWFDVYHCQCVDGFSGDVCETQSKESNSIFIIAGAAGGGVLIGVVIGIIVSIICRCRRQQSVQEVHFDCLYSSAIF
ncbi:hypothetical protein LSAT2_021251 [Lamellibrachia satsuma]|nr:hypothetical protein LSAT2_021251 [Lamellibrachia satsuma]